MPTPPYTPIALATLAAMLATAPLAAQDTTATNDSLVKKLERLERTVDSLRTIAEQQTQRLIELDERTSSTPTQTRPSTLDTTRRSLTSTSGIYGKPFVKRFGAGTAVGGYIDLEYRNALDQHTSRFDQHRLIPFLFSEITDKLHFGTEIEFEHGANIEVDGGEAEGAGEVNVEFATLDYTLTEALNLRGGIILAPLGRFNLVHDSPINELTDRPLVSTEIEPTTLSEAGFGLFGTIYPTERALVSYELYVVNGFTPGIFEQEDGEVALRLREGRGLRGEDNNSAKSLVGRLAFSPFLGLELGASAHTGRYASRDSLFSGRERLTIWGLDATFQHGPFDLLGEYAQADVDIPAAFAAQGVIGTQNGYYVQGNYHFGHGLIPPHATSSFTGVVRWDYVDFARHATGDTRERLTLGLNWRPVPEAVLKTDFQWNWTTPRGSTRRGPVDRQLLVSMATYF